MADDFYNRYHGQVDFGDWFPPIRGIEDMANELQATFANDDQINHWWFTPDGMGVFFEMESLGDGNPPTFFTTLQDMAEWAVERATEDHPDDRVDPAPLIKELRRIAELIDSDTKTRNSKDAS